MCVCVCVCAGSINVCAVLGGENVLVVGLGLGKDMRLVGYCCTSEKKVRTLSLFAFI